VRFELDFRITCRFKFNGAKLWISTEVSMFIVSLRQLYLFKLKFRTFHNINMVTVRTAQLGTIMLLFTIFKPGCLCMCC
jgi:hypothetical protein